MFSEVGRQLGDSCCVGPGICTGEFILFSNVVRQLCESCYRQAKSNATQLEFFHDTGTALFRAQSLDKISHYSNLQLLVKVRINILKR